MRNTRTTHNGSAGAVYWVGRMAARTLCSTITHMAVLLLRCTTSPLRGNPIGAKSRVWGVVGGRFGGDIQESTIWGLWVIRGFTPIWGCIPTHDQLLPRDPWKQGTTPRGMGLRRCPPSGGWCTRPHNPRAGVLAGCWEVSRNAPNNVAERAHL